MAPSEVETRIGDNYKFVPIILGSAIAALLATQIMRDFLRDLGQGGNAWKQGDWLINSNLIWIRRGITGSAEIRISDLLHVSPLTTVVGIQCALFAVALFCLLVLAGNFLSRIEYWIVLFSPGMFFINWAGNPQGAGRKELVTYAVLGMLGVATRSKRNSKCLIIVSLLLYCFGALAHDVNVLLWPVVALMFVIVSRRQNLGHTWPLVAGALSGAVAIFAAGFSVIYSQAPNIQSICEPLIKRGLSPDVCSGAIESATFNAHQETSKLVGALVVYGHGSIVLGIAKEVFIYLATVTPLVYLTFIHKRPFALLAVQVMIALLMLPLYFVALDWGRWLVIQVTVYGFVLLALVQSEFTEIRKPQPQWIVIPLLAFSFLWVPHETPGLFHWGFLPRVIRDFHAIILR